MSSAAKSVRIGLIVNMLKMACLYVLMVHVLHRPDYFLHFHGDTKSYFDPIVHLLNFGDYSPDFRMPGYGGLYFVFFTITQSDQVTLYLIIFFQFIFSGISIGLMAQLIFEFTNSKTLFILSFLFLEISYYLLYDCYLSSESLATSLLVFITYIVSKSGKSPFLLGICFIWLVFVKSIFILLILPLIGYLVIQKTSLRFWVLFFIPILIIEGAWISRNALKYKQFIPLTHQMFYPEGTNGIIYGYLSVQELIRSYGGSHQFWRLDSDAAWYFSGGFADPYFIGDTPFPNFKENDMRKPPAEIYTSKMNLDSLVKIRYALTSIYLTSIDSKTKHVIDKECSNEIQYIRDRTLVYVNSIRNEKPILYYFNANLTRLKSIIFTTYFFDNILQNPSLNNRINFFVAILLQGFIYLMNGLVWGFSILSLLGVFRFGFKLKSPTVLTWVAWLNAYTFILYIFVFKQAEERYFCVLYPFWVLVSLTLINQWILKFKN
ncbi:hypothetical protein [Aquirufa sp.]|jgi:hypothetical protein|uniref:hypothetical protein n=1 Tax=Aquirufa sp. TaxID=2676249 RepID=UPI0037C05BF4